MVASVPGSLVIVATVLSSGITSNWWIVLALLFISDSALEKIPRISFPRDFFGVTPKLGSRSDWLSWFTLV